MAAVTTVLKLTQVQGVVKVHGENSDSATIALATTLKKNTETQSSPEVNIKRIYWSCDKNADITITRNSVILYHFHDAGELDFNGFSDIQENGSDMVINFNNGYGTIIIDVAKVAGYGSQQHQGADGDLG
tara:strand:- start:784 stop:1173 length:390 start_codon:yes stop_codon:yes gene_type:complete